MKPVQSPLPRRARPLLALALVFAGTGGATACGSVRQAPPPIQPSSPEAATAIVRVQSGQPFKNACLVVELGATVEWRNLSPRTAVSMLSVRAPYELSSPALIAPYNLTPVERSDECVRREGASCVEALPFSFWRHTFRELGVFDYRDASGGAMAATGYSYGLPAGPSPTTSTTATGTVCVRSAFGSSECDGVCCLGNIAGECAAGLTCINSRCGGVSTQ
jgi:hypothetical protein